MKPCLRWDKALTKAGYGSVWNKGKVCYAHRLAWEKENGKIPRGLCVLHRCDNRACCEISHLFLGTRKDNAIDKTRKGRGISVGAKLSIQEKKEIQSLLGMGLSLSELAKRFNITKEAVFWHKKYGKSIWG